MEGDFFCMRQQFICGKLDPGPDGLRKFSPLGSRHPLIVEAMSCASCGTTFRVGDITTLVPVGPGTFDDARMRARQGRWFSGVGVPVHWDCATGGDE
jgi:hypothetical protein